MEREAVSLAPSESVARLRLHLCPLVQCAFSLL